jgi:hypothetical protein
MTATVAVVRQATVWRPRREGLPAYTAHVKGVTLTVYKDEGSGGWWRARLSAIGMSPVVSPDHFAELADAQRWAVTLASRI